MNLTEEREDILDKITTFNINARYPDYKKKFGDRCTSGYTKQSIEKIKELRTWLLSHLEK